ncbi:NADH dehydrogenase subunit 4L (mitochondrion) [Mercenaria mercenaria]|uniref:NADH-ubiquinone oxidoreductase chain 4L n=1 Tax=Mercenaria mercenaria TaxID=6596 RepID=A0A6H0JQN4_MERMC|nr:NADH dehydrogenase subunit 4L [Mercenaria mercenaria]QIU83220.1 NADH dehydrogenase subunit 4L [Mercenaria mercenaria]
MLMSVCFFSLLQLFFQMKYFMNLLLTFELLTICVFLMCVYLGNVSFSLVSVYFCVLILCLGVSESVMGLAILVNCSRFSGKSTVKSFSFLGF